MRMWALPLSLWNALRTIHSSLGLKREVFGLAVTYLLLRFYGQGRDFLLAQGFRELPDVHGAWIAAAFAGIYLLWNSAAACGRARVQSRAKAGSQDFGPKSALRHLRDHR